MFANGVPPVADAYQTTFVSFTKILANVGKADKQNVCVVLGVVITLGEFTFTVTANLAGFSHPIALETAP
ncbi:hypothetical protein D3C80_707000 [compost metagenome]